MRPPRSISIATAALAALAALVFGGGFASPAAADTDPTQVSIVGCYFFEGGETTVPAGTVEIGPEIWAVGTKGALVHWLNSQQTTITVQYDDEEATTQDFTDQWTDPAQFEDDKLWFSELQGPTLELAAGETVLVTEVMSWTSPTLEFFFNPGEHPVLYKGNNIETSCLITAV
jgi:hypothetical protein